MSGLLGSVAWASRSSATFDGRLSGLAGGMRALAESTRLFPLLAAGFLIQVPMLFIAIGIGMVGRSFDVLIGDIVGVLLSPGIEYFWHEGFHSDSPFGGLIVGVIVNTFYFATILFVCCVVWTRIRIRSRGHRTSA